MKKVITLFLMMPILANAQKLIGGSNIVKWNASSILLKNYHFTYERHIYKNLSVSVSYRTMPFGNIPYQQEIQDAVNTSEINFSRFQMGNSAFTIEPRIYLSMGKMKGFYLAPYLRFATFNVSAPIKYTSTAVLPAVSKDADFTGKITSTSGGLMIGYQFQILKKLVLDFQIIGAHYGSSKGDLSFAATLNSFEQQSLRDNINSIEAEPFKFTSTVNGNGARINTDGPWAGIRGLNLGIGLRF
jgi:Protein of unknown function (DUF3575)